MEQTLDRSPTGKGAVVQNLQSRQQKESRLQDQKKSRPQDHQEAPLDELVQAFLGQLDKGGGDRGLVQDSGLTASMEEDPIASPEPHASALVQAFLGQLDKGGGDRGLVQDSGLTASMEEDPIASPEPHASALVQAFLGQLDKGGGDRGLVQDSGLLMAPPQGLSAQAAPVEDDPSASPESQSFKGEEEKMMPAIKRPSKEVQDQAHSNEKVASATVSVPTTTSVAAAAATNHASSEEQLREEYMEALKLYINTQSQSGEVSSVIPMFFQEAVKQEELAMSDNDQSCTSVTAVKHSPASSPRDEFFADLGAQYLPHFKHPAPDYISLMPLAKRHKKVGWSMDNLSDAKDNHSDFKSGSLYPSSDDGSSFCSSDYDSSSSEEN